MLYLSAIKKSVSVGILILLVSFVSTNISAATLNVSGGILLGAFDVDVNGTLYDVEFMDGSCVDLFNGCDDPSDFVLNTLAFANQASVALLDQVFVNGPAGNFDDFPALTLGCSDPLTCFTYTVNNPPGIRTRAARNEGVGGVDSLDGSVHASNTPTFDTTTALDTNYAVWSLASSASVPLPGTILLFGSSLAGLGFVRRHLK